MEQYKSDVKKIMASFNKQIWGNFWEFMQFQTSANPISDKLSNPNTSV